MTFRRNIPYMVNYFVFSLNIPVTIKILYEMNKILHEKLLNAIYLAWQNQLFLIISFWRSKLKISHIQMYCIDMDPWVHSKFPSSLDKYVTSRCCQILLVTVQDLKRSGHSPISTINTLDWAYRYSLMILTKPLIYQ